MRQILLGLLLIGLTAATTGCRICANPFDYCGPTYVGECGPVCCNPDARAGSVLSPPLEPMAGPGMMIEESIEPTITSEIVLEESMEATGETSLDPIPIEEDIVAPLAKTKAGRLVSLPPPLRSPAKASGPTYLR